MSANYYYIAKLFIYLLTMQLWENWLDFPYFSFPQNGDNKGAYLEGLLRGLVIKNIHYLEQCLPYS